MTTVRNPRAKKTPSKGMPCQCKAGNRCKQTACPCRLDDTRREAEQAGYCDFCRVLYCKCDGECQGAAAEECACASGTREKAPKGRLCTGCHERLKSEAAFKSRRARNKKYNEKQRTCPTIGESATCGASWSMCKCVSWFMDDGLCTGDRTPTNDEIKKAMWRLEQNKASLHATSETQRDAYLERVRDTWTNIFLRCPLSERTLADYLLMYDVWVKSRAPMTPLERARRWSPQLYPRLIQWLWHHAPPDEMPDARRCAAFAVLHLIYEDPLNPAAMQEVHDLYAEDPEPFEHALASLPSLRPACSLPSKSPYEEGGVHFAYVESLTMPPLFESMHRCVVEWLHTELQADATRELTQHEQLLLVQAVGAMSQEAGDANPAAASHLVEIERAFESDPTKFGRMFCDWLLDYLHADSTGRMSLATAPDDSPNAGRQYWRCSKCPTAPFGGWRDIADQSHPVCPQCVPIPLPPVFDWQCAGYVEVPEKQRFGQLRLVPELPSMDSVRERDHRGWVFERYLQYLSKLPCTHPEFHALQAKLAPVTMHEVLTCVRGFMNGSSVDSMDQSCTCACCGARVSKTCDTFDIDADPDVAAVFDHAVACRDGFPLSRVYLEDGCVSLLDGAPVVRGDKVLVAIDDTPGRVTVDTRDGYPGVVTAVRRNGTVDVKFNRSYAVYAPAPPACGGGTDCPLRSQYHGLHAVRDSASPASEQAGWRLFCLLGQRDWHDVDDSYDSSKVVDAWASTTEFRACPRCATSLRESEPHARKVSLLRLQLQIVPSARVELLLDWSKLAGWYDGSRTGRAGLLTPPSLTERQMLAAIRMNSYIVRLISSSKQDKSRYAQGLGASDPVDKSKGMFRPRRGQEESSDGLQRGLKKHTIGCGQR